MIHLSFSERVVAYAASASPVIFLTSTLALGIDGRYGRCLGFASGDFFMGTSPILRVEEHIKQQREAQRGEGPT